MVSSLDLELNVILPYSLHLVGNQSISVKELNNNILYIFMQKSLTWIGHLISFPHKSIKFSLFDDNRYCLDINAQISYGLLIKCWEQNFLL